MVLLALSWLLAGFVLDGLGSALLAAVLVGVLNALVWPALSRLALPLNVLTLGLGGLVLNALLVGLVINLLPGAEVSGIVDPIVITIVLAATTAVVNYVLAIDDDEWWYRQVVRRQARRRGDVTVSEVPGLLLLEIDGLAHDVLLRAIRGGSAPTLGAWLRSGSHLLHQWETDWSSQTGACQAGILHGSNDDMPAFRWWEKDSGRPIVTNHPRDAAELERRHSDGRGLLHADGASRANILSGDATHSMLTMSTALTRRRPLGRDYSAYFARPYAVARRSSSPSPTSPASAAPPRAQVREDERPRRPRPLLRLAARLGDGRPARPPGGDGDRRRPRRAVPASTPPSSPTTRSPTTPGSSAPTRSPSSTTSTARSPASPAPARRRRAPIALSSSPTTVSRRGKPSAIASAARWRSWCGRAATPVACSPPIGGDDNALSYIGAGLTEVARDDTMAGRTVRAATRGQVADGAVMLDRDGRREPDTAADRSCRSSR